MFQKLWRFARHYWKFSTAIITSAVALVFQFTGPVFITNWLLGVAALVLTVPLLVDMWQDLRDGTYGVDILAATAIITSVVLQQYWAAIVIVLMLTGGEALEAYAESRAKVELTALLEHAPHVAHVLRRGKQTDIAIREVLTGDKVIIKTGEVVPVDAVIIEGQATFDESSLTGESLPERKSHGDTILSGSVNLDGTITARALRPAADSQYEQIVKLVKAAANSKAPFVRLADRYAIPFTIVSFGIGIGVWVLSGQAIRFLEVLVVATPCPLILAAPIAIISGMSRASKAGIIVKNGGALERLAEARSVAFDKTGTLTHGKLKVARVKTFGKFTTAEVLGYAASVEQGSTHVLAQAIINRANSLKAKAYKTKNVREDAGYGLMASVNGHNVLVGRNSLLATHSVEIPKNVAETSADKTSTYVAINGQLAGIISFEDEIRADSQRTIARLRSSGINTIYLITGDNVATAKRVAKQVGINLKHVVAGALPIDKLKVVEQSLESPVAFVGDGVNDAPVLVASAVGIALGAKGSTAASQSADIVVLRDEVSKVADVHTIAIRTFKIARQSILIGIGLSVGLMAIFATGKFKPIYGAAVQELVDVAVIFNALRAHVAGKTPKA
ncbi:MAG: heavy metal translocating P-type ATPase [Candidatus Saccharimonadales bacterium]